MHHRLVVLPIVTGVLALLFTGPCATAEAQQAHVAVAPAASAPVTGDLLAQGFEVKTVVNNTYLILQKGGKTYWCGSNSANLTWSTWPAETRDAPCTALNK